MGGNHQRTSEPERQHLAAEKSAVRATVSAQPPPEFDVQEQRQLEEVSDAQKRQIARYWKKTWTAISEGPLTFRRMLATTELAAILMSKHLLRLKRPSDSAPDSAHMRFRQDLRTIAKRYIEFVDAARKLGLAEHKVRPHAQDVTITFEMPGADVDPWAEIREAEALADEDGSLYRAAAETVHQEIAAEAMDDDDLDDDDEEDEDG